MKSFVVHVQSDALVKAQKLLGQLKSLPGVELKEITEAIERLNTPRPVITSMAWAVKDMKLPPRVIRVLNAAGIHWLHDLAERTPSELRALEGIGEVSLQLIREQVLLLGKRFK